MTKDEKWAAFAIATSPDNLAKAIESGRINRLKVFADRARSCLSVWYPLVKDIVPTPRTEIVRTEIDYLVPLWNENKEPENYEHFINQIKGAISRIGSTPVFLRTGLTSAKHSWRNACYLDDVGRLKEHIAEISIFSAMVDLPDNVWAVREMLPVESPFTAFHGDMPITSERRYFVMDGKVICSHPYWPQESIEDANVTGWQSMLGNLNAEKPGEKALLTFNSEKISNAVEGYWSVDWLWTKKGWYLTDMGVGEQSYHWPDCPFDIKHMPGD